MSVIRLNSAVPECPALPSECSYVSYISHSTLWTMLTTGKYPQQMTVSVSRAGQADPGGEAKQARGPSKR
jgi:hypothetical protein